MNGNNFSTLLTSDIAGAGTALIVTSTAGWQNGDTIVIASTTQTASQCESRTIVTVDSATQVTVAAVTNAHSGTAPIQAEVINISHNVKIRGISAANNSYINCNALSRIVIRYSEFANLGSATANKRGIDVAATTGGFDLQYSSVHDCTNNGPAIAINISSASGGNIQVQHCSFYNNFRSAIVNVSTTGIQIFNDLVCIMSNDASATIYNLFSFADAGCTYTNITGVGNQSTQNTSNCISIAEAPSSVNGFLGICSNLTAHSGLGHGITLSVAGNVSNLVIWRLNSGAAAGTAGLVLNGMLTIDGGTLFGSGGQNILFLCGGNIIRNATVASDSTFSTALGIRITSQTLVFSPMGQNTFENCTFGVVNGIFRNHTSADIGQFSNISANSVLNLYNCNLASPLDVLTQSNNPSFPVYNYLFSQKHNQTLGNHKTYLAEGRIQTDTGIYRTTSPSMRFLPIFSGRILQQPFGYGFRLPVNSGQSINTNVWVRKSVLGDGTAYNGSQPQLVLRRNYALGFTGDSILAIANSGLSGVWEYLQGTTPLATDDGVCEFTISMTGANVPTGWVNVSDFNNDKLKYWQNGLPFNQNILESITFS